MAKKRRQKPRSAAQKAATKRLIVAYNKKKRAATMKLLMTRRKKKRNVRAIKKRSSYSRRAGSLFNNYGELKENRSLDRTFLAAEDRVHRYSKKYGSKNRKTLHAKKTLARINKKMDRLGKARRDAYVNG